MKFAGKLLNKFDERFILRYEEDLVKYKKEPDRWEFDKDTSYKAHREFDIPEPQQPKEVELKIPNNEDWVDQTPDYTKISVEDQFENEGENVLNDYDFLEMHSTDVRLTDTQWKLLNRTYSMKLKDVCLEDDKTLKSIVKRHGLMTLRLAMILTALRKAEDKSFQTIHYCTETDYNIATEIICCCLEHSFLLSTTLPDDRTSMLPIRIAQPMQAMFGKLPSPFTLKQALEIGETLHIKKRTLYAYIKKADGIKIEKLAPGVYRKL